MALLAVGRKKRVAKSPNFRTTYSPASVIGRGRGEDELDSRFRITKLVNRKSPMTQ